MSGPETCPEFSRREFQHQVQTQSLLIPTPHRRPALPWRVRSLPSSGLSRHTCTSWPCQGSRSSRLVEAGESRAHLQAENPAHRPLGYRQPRWRRGGPTCCDFGSWAQAGDGPAQLGGCQLSLAKGVSLFVLTHLTLRAKSY